MATRVLDNIWIGLAEVVQFPGAMTILDRNKAFVTVLAQATGMDDYLSKVRRAFNDAGFDLLAVEEVESVAVRMQSVRLPAGTVELAAEAQRTGEVQWGKFHTWIREDDEDALV